MNEIPQIYTSVFEGDNGKTVLKELETFILTTTPFHTEDIATDALLREGARVLLNHIYDQLP